MSTYPVAPGLASVHLAFRVLQSWSVRAKGQDGHSGCCSRAVSRKSAGIPGVAVLERWDEHLSRTPGLASVRAPGLASCESSWDLCEQKRSQERLGWHFPVHLA